MNAIEAIQGEIDKREQEIEALRLSLSIISGRADVRLVKKEPVGPIVQKGVITGRWTKQDDERVNELFKEGIDDSEIGKELGRTAVSVRCRRSLLGDIYAKRKNWTTKEDEKLKRLVDSGLDDSGLSNELNRTESAIKIRRSKLGLSQLEKKPDIFDDEPVEDKLVSIGHNQPWTKEDIEQLKELDEKGYGNDRIASEMGRTSGAVAVRKSNMGFSKSKKKKKHTRKDWTGADDQMVIGMCRNGYSTDQIAKRLKRTESSIKNRTNLFKEKGKL